MKKLLSTMLLLGVSASIVFAAHGGFKDSATVKKANIAEVLKMQIMTD